MAISFPRYNNLAQSDLSLTNIIDGRLNPLNSEKRSLHLKVEEGSLGQEVRNPIVFDDIRMIKSRAYDGHGMVKLSAPTCGRKPTSLEDQLRLSGK